MTAHPTLQHDDVSRHLLVLSVAKLWKGGAAAAAALCRHLSLFGMCTFVNDDRLGSMMTRDRKLSREHGPAASETSHRPRRRIVLSRRAPASNWPAGQSIGRRLVFRVARNPGQQFLVALPPLHFFLGVLSCATRALVSNWTPARTPE